MKQTPLYQQHQANNAFMGEFAGFEMPLYFSSVKEEAQAVRKSVGIFDVSHMGNILVTGVKSREFLENLLVSSLQNLKALKMKYTAMCNEQGGVIDDLVVTCLDDNAYHLVVNAANIERVYDWMQQHLITGVELKNKSERLGIIALQGPFAKDVVQKLANRKVEHLNRFYSRSSIVGSQLLLYSRTGYTGEDGFEFYPSSKNTVTLWNELMEAGQEYGIKPIGLIARDLLRLEAGYSLHGSELSEEQNLLESGLQWLVDFSKETFIGKEALQQNQTTGISQKVVGIKTLQKAIPRAGDVLLWNDKPCGKLTSGNFSFTLNYGIGLGVLLQEYVSHTSGFFLKAQNKKIPIEVVSRYFYKNI